MIDCRCCTCEHSTGKEGCAALWEKATTPLDWKDLPQDTLPKRIQRWIDTWKQKGVDHGRGFLCPPPSTDICPGHTPTTRPVPHEWVVYSTDAPDVNFGFVYALTEEDALEIVQDVEGDDPRIKVRRVEEGTRGSNRSPAA